MNRIVRASLHASCELFFVVTVFSALVGCSRGDELVLWNGHTQEILVHKVQLDGVLIPGSTEVVVDAAQQPNRKGGSLSLTAGPASDAPKVSVEWSRNKVLTQGSCVYERPKKNRCEVDIYISEIGLTCGTCGQPL
jgi:hypothetical protein